MHTSVCTATGSSRTHVKGTPTSRGGRDAHHEDTRDKPPNPHVLPTRHDISNRIAPPRERQREREREAEGTPQGAVHLSPVWWHTQRGRDRGSSIVPMFRRSVSIQGDRRGNPYSLRPFSHTSTCVCVLWDQAVSFKFRQ